MTTLEAKEQSDNEFEAQGFTWADWNKWKYTGPDNFPTFTVAPGSVGLVTGLVATFIDVKILFPYGTPPADIKTRLDAEISQMPRTEQPLDDWAEMEAEGLAIDVDDFMAEGKWARS